jgi:putative transposase
VLLDLYSRKVVGWAMSSRLDAIMVQEALHMAMGRRKPSAGLMHHSDRGSQYACHTYQRLLGAHGVGCSMSRKGECLDNAVAERFFGSLTREREEVIQTFVSAIVYAVPRSPVFMGSSISISRLTPHS